MTATLVTVAPPGQGGARFPILEAGSLLSAGLTAGAQ